MSIVKKIEIDGKEVAFKCKRAIPRIIDLNFRETL